MTASLGLLHDLFAGGLGLVAALVGSVVGALATGQITRRLGRESRVAERLEADELNSFAMQHKLLVIYSVAMDIVQHFQSARATAAAHETSHIAMSVNPFANRLVRIEFSTAELLSLSRVGGVELYNQVASLDRAYDISVQVLETFFEKREELTGRWPGESDEGGFVMTRIPLDQYNSNKHLFRRLDDLVRQIEESADEIYKLSFVALKSLVEAQGPYFGKRIGLSLRRIGESDVKIEATPSGRRVGRLDAMKAKKSANEIPAE